MVTDDISKKAAFQNHFNLMRLILAVMVLFSHSWGLLCLQEPVIVLRSFGNFAVHAFFVLSGYMITKSFINSKSVADYLYKRILRILPVYLLTVFLCNNIIDSLFSSFINNPTPYILNGSIWTLSYEILLYLIIAIMGVFDILNEYVLGAAVAVGFVLIIVFHDNNSPFNLILAPMFFEFFMGSLLSFTEKKIHLKPLGIVSIISLILIQFHPEIWTSFSHMLPWLYAPTFGTAFLCYIIYLITLPPALLFIGTGIRTFKFEKIFIENDISYGVYMYAWPIQQITIYYLLNKNHTLNPWIIFCISLLATILVSIVSCKLIEQPIMKLKKHGSKLTIRKIEN